jgi:3-hydroxyacyl-[acyl-carrier-protein] dehydratase
MTDALPPDLPLLPEPVPASDIIPQALPMCLIDSLIACQDGAGCAVVRISHDGLFVEPSGWLSSAGLTELIAQTSAAQKTHEAILAGDPPKQGFLVGIKNLRILGGCRAGETVTIVCRRTFTMGEASLVEGVVRLDDRTLAEGTIKVWEQEEFPTRPDVPADQSVREQASSGGGAPGSPIRRALLARMRDIETPSAPPSETGPAQSPTATAAFHLDAGFPAFEGHFPGYPILPAVVMLEIGVLLAERAAGHALRLLGIPHAKFSRTSYPGDVLVASVSTSSPLVASEPSEVAVRLTRAGDRVASFTILVAKSPPQ